MQVYEDPPLPFHLLIEPLRVIFSAYVLRHRLYDIS